MQQGDAPEALSVLLFSGEHWGAQRRERTLPQPDGKAGLSLALSHEVVPAESGKSCHVVWGLDLGSDPGTDGPCDCEPDTWPLQALASWCEMGPYGSCTGCHVLGEASMCAARGPGGRSGNWGCSSQRPLFALSGGFPQIPH